jgi:hypothetical protein
VAIRILKRVVLSFRCAKNNKTLFRIQFHLSCVSFRHRKTILRTRPSHWCRNPFDEQFRWQVWNSINPARCVHSTWRPFYLWVIPLLATKFTIVSYKLVKIYVNSNKCIKCRLQKPSWAAMRHAERFEPHLRANKISLPPPPLIDKAQKNRTFFSNSASSQLRSRSHIL